MHMRRIIAAVFFCLGLAASSTTFAMLSLELTRGVAGAIPIAVVPFEGAMDAPQNVSTIISNDLNNSGRFKVSSDGSSNNAADWVTGNVQPVGGDRYAVSFQLAEKYDGKTPDSNQKSVVLTQKFTVSGSELRRLAHHISDLIYQQMTGVRGVFSTKLAYIVVDRSPSQTRYRLEVSDQDGYNPQPLLTSTDPIMSPAWSPNGRQIAYVSFEKKYAAIYIHDVGTGSRSLVSEFPGINGAPAWSPDGSKLALVLSKDGSPNIYLLNVSTRQLTQVTRDWSINTEPAWSPNGQSIIFTSNRSGNPQIYQKNISTGAVTRLTYNGNYNARASFASDGNHIVVLNRESNLYNIGILDLDTGVFRVLTNSSRTDNESPSVAPNGSMVLYGTLYGGQSVLGMVASDGSVQLRLPARSGEVQDPAWSPFLS